MSTKPKPRWDVHLQAAGNRAWSLAGVPLTLIAEPSGNVVSLRLVRLANPLRKLRTFSGTASLLPKQRFPIASLPRPTPNRFLSVEVLAVAWQIHQPPRQKPQRNRHWDTQTLRNIERGLPWAISCHSGESYNVDKWVGHPRRRGIRCWPLSSNLECGGWTRKE